MIDYNIPVLLRTVSCIWKSCLRCNLKDITLVGMIAAKPPDSNTDEDFSKALKSDKPVVVDFGSNSCIPCRQMRPILQEIRKEYLGKAEVLVIDVYKYQGLAREYKIQMIPTLIFFDSNAKEVHRHQGFMSKKALLEQLKKMGIS